MEANKTINYYGTDSISQEKLLALIDEAVASLVRLDLNESVQTTKFVQIVFEVPEVAALLIQLSRLPVFDTEYARSLQHDLDLLALT